MKDRPHRYVATATFGLIVAAALSSGPAGGQTQSTPGRKAEQGAPKATGTGRLATETAVELLELTVSEDGQERRRFVAADKVRAGDQVYYTIRVRNPGRVAVENVVVTKPVPYGMLYATGSAVGPGAEIVFSVDGGDSFARASRLEVHATGQPRRRATPADYTHVRWRLRHPLAPGATALLRFRATLD